MSAGNKKQEPDPTAEEATKLALTWLTAVLMGWAGYTIAVSSQVGWESLSFWFFVGLGVVAVAVTLLWSMLRKL